MSYFFISSHWIGSVLLHIVCFWKTSKIYLFFFLQLPFAIKACHIFVINLYYKSTHTRLCEYRKRKWGSKTGALVPPERCEKDCGAAPMEKVCLCPLGARGFHWEPGGTVLSAVLFLQPAVTLVSNALIEVESITMSILNQG